MYDRLDKLCSALAEVQLKTKAVRITLNTFLCKIFKRSDDFFFQPNFGSLLVWWSFAWDRPRIPDAKIISLIITLLNIGPIRMYILMLGTRNVGCRTNERCTYVHWRIYSSRYLDIAVHEMKIWSLNDHIGKYTGIYTIATMEEKCENCS